MKKVFCILLSVMIVLVSVIPANAWTFVDETRSQIPVIRISGDGEPLYNAEGERIMHFRGLLESNDEEENGDDKITDAVVNILMPFLREGILFNKWDNYYAALQTEISELFGEALLDNNGNPLPGTGLSQNKRNQMEQLKKTDKKIGKGYYAYNDYWFNYDWRLLTIDKQIESPTPTDSAIIISRLFTVPSVISSTCALSTCTAGSASTTTAPIIKLNITSTILFSASSVPSL